MNIIDELTWRDAINQQTNEERLRELVDEKSISLYCGVDPTGDSMHIGHLIPFMMMKRFQLAGHHPYILIGGGTGTIGDPSGRKTERVLQTRRTCFYRGNAPRRAGQKFRRPPRRIDKPRAKGRRTRICIQCPTLQVPVLPT